MAKSIFYDPDRKRWGRLRILLSVLGAIVGSLVLFFIITVFVQADPLPHVLMPEQKRNLRALKEREHRKRPSTKNTHRKTKSSPSQVVLNADEGIRAAYYVTWDAASFVSLKEYYPQIDILFPEWLHVLTPDGHLQGFDSVNHPFQVVENGIVHSTDDRVMPFLRAEKAEMEVFPLINNFETVSKQWLPTIGDFLMDPAARQTFRKQLLLYLASDRFKGAAIDFEEIPLKAQPGFLALIQELGRDLHARGLRLYVNVPVA
ncbi:MAG TPA: polysaccharide deacetylase, partial [Candidatus Angelobacter sp.]